MKILNVLIFLLLMPSIAWAGQPIDNFWPVATKEITSPSTSSQRVTFAAAGDQPDILVTNATDKTCRVEFGGSTVTATDADGNSTPVAAGVAMILHSGKNLSAAVICIASPTSGKVYLTRGKGN